MSRGYDSITVNRESSHPPAVGIRTQPLLSRVRTTRNPPLTGSLKDPRKHETPGGQNARTVGRSRARTLAQCLDRRGHWRRSTVIGWAKVRFKGACAHA